MTDNSCPTCGYKMDRVERLMRIETAAKRVLETFRKDEAQGYRSRDRQFAIEILGVAVDGQSSK